MNILEEYVKIVSNICDAPEVFIKASGYGLVSNLLGRYFTCQMMPHGRPNLWFLISSIPGRFRRSTVASYYDHAYTQALTKYLELKQEQKQLVENEEETSLIKESMIEEGTPEGIADMITYSYEKGINTYNIFSSEFGGVLKRMQEQQYMSGTLNLLSKLYYGEGGIVLLSRRSGGKPRVIPKGLYVTMFAGMQEPELYLEPSMIRQGTMRRILLIYVKKAQRWIEPIRIGYETAYDEITAWSHKIAQLMLKYERLQNGHQEEYFEKFAYLHLFVLDKQQYDINSYAQSLDKQLDDATTNENIYRQSLWEHLSKLAFINTIADGEIKETEKDMANMVVKSEHLENAKQYLNDIEKGMEGVIDSLGERQKIMQSYKTPLETVYGIVVSHPGIKKSGIYQHCPNWLKGQVTELLETLIAQRRITVQIIQSSIGRPSVSYYSSNPP